MLDETREPVIGLTCIRIWARELPRSIYYILKFCHVICTHVSKPVVDFPVLGRRWNGGFSFLMFSL